MLSVFFVCWIFLQTFQTYFFIQANNVDPDQTAPRGSLIWVYTVCKNDLKSQADDKADDNCCDWQFKDQHIKSFFFLRIASSYTTPTATNTNAKFTNLRELCQAFVHLFGSII